MKKILHTPPFPLPPSPFPNFKRKKAKAL